ncbi:hypothetical protein FQA47_001694, partial [Oryzias melastigma]
GAARVLHPWAFLHHVPVRTGVADRWAQHPPPLLQHMEVLSLPNGHQGAAVRPRICDERRHAQVLPEGGLVQTVLLRPLLLLLSLLCLEPGNIPLLGLINGNISSMIYSLVTS